MDNMPIFRILCFGTFQMYDNCLLFLCMDKDSRLIRGQILIQTTNQIVQEKITLDITNDNSGIFIRKEAHEKEWVFELLNAL